MAASLAEMGAVTKYVKFHETHYFPVVDSIQKSKGHLLQLPLGPSKQ